MLVYTPYILRLEGEMAEWLKAPLSKSGMGETSSRVQIPLSPQNINLHIQQNLPKIFQSLVNLNNSCLHERGIDQFSLTFKLVKINN